MDLQISKNQGTMSLKEVALLFGVTTEALKKHIRVLYPEKMQNGIETKLNEEEITLIKSKMIPTTAVVGTNTDFEKKLYELLRNLQILNKK
jgi:hypothetical protein